MGEIFERTAPATPLDWTGERLTTAVSGQIEIEHLHRYFLARELCRGLDVLDVASGEGYGTALLAQTAKSAIGVELAADAARHAAAQYRVPNLRFLEGDARALPLPDASVDAVVSFETIEHFYEQDRFLAEVKRVLRPGGLLLVSSPDRDVYSPPGTAANPYHARELSRDEFETLLGRHFAHVAVLGQRPVLGSALLARQEPGLAPLTFERRGERRYEASPGLPRAIYLVAIASDAADRVAVPSSLYIDRDDVGDVLNRAATVTAVSAELHAAQARLQAAEAGAASLRAELERSVEQAGMQARTYVGQLDAASEQIRGYEQRLAQQAHDWQAQLAAEQRAAEERMRAQNQAHAADLANHRQAWEAERGGGERVAAELAALREALDAAKTELEAAREQASSAAAQRDMARMGLRRAGVFAENGWRARVEALQQQVQALHDQQQERERRHEEAEREMEAWRVRYHILRGRLELVLRRSGLLPATRIVPKPMRQWVLDAIRNRTRT